MKWERDFPYQAKGREGSAENDQANRQFLAVTIQVIPAGAHLSRIQHGEWATEALRHWVTQGPHPPLLPQAGSSVRKGLGNKPMESTRTRATSCQIPIPISCHVISSHVIVDRAVVLWPRHTVAPLVLRNGGERRAVSVMRGAERNTGSESHARTSVSFHLSF